MPNIQLFGDVTDFINNLPDNISAKILAHLKSLEMNLTEALAIKTLKGKIKELIVKQYRIVFFQENGIIYVVDIFKKQSRKTPKGIIERAEEIYRILNR